MEFGKDRRTEAGRHRLSEENRKARNRRRTRGARALAQRRRCLGAEAKPVIQPCGVSLAKGPEANDIGNLDRFMLDDRKGGRIDERRKRIARILMVAGLDRVGEEVMLDAMGDQTQLQNEQQERD